MCGRIEDDPSMHDSQEPRLACEVRLGFTVRPDGIGFDPEFCTSRTTTEYIDIWGTSHAVCDDPTHERRLRSIYPESIQRQLYEDVRKQESLMPSGRAIGGSLRPGVPVFDDSDYRRRDK